MADLVREGGGVDEEELRVLEKSGVLASRRLEGKARSVRGPKHIVFVEEGEEGVFWIRSLWCFMWIDLVRCVRNSLEPCSCPGTRIQRGHVGG